MVERVEVPAEEGLQSNAGEKADNTKTVQEVVGRPEWLPENFNSVEQFLESHKELRADHTRKAQELSELKKAPAADLPSDEGNTPDETPSDDKPSEDDGERFLPGMENADVQAISDYAWENGELTDDHYDQLAKAGYSKDVVDQYMAGQMNQAANTQESLLNAGGGSEAVQSMFDWAQSSLAESEVDMYNAKFASGGADAIMAMEHLKGRYDASGVNPTGKPVSGANAPGESTATYKSIAEMQRDMSDPRYQHDPAFRAAVASKLDRSSIL